MATHEEICLHALDHYLELCKRKTKQSKVVTVHPIILCALKFYTEHGEDKKLLEENE